MLIYKLGDVLSRQNCSLKTASRIGNIIRKILFQNTNGTSNVGREVDRIIANLKAEFGELIGSLNTPALQFAAIRA